MPKDTRILVVVDRPDLIHPIFERSHPTVDIAYLSDKNAVGETLKAVNPTVVLAFPGYPIPKERFPKMLDHPTVEWFSNTGAGVEHLGQWDPAVKTVTNGSGVNARYLSEYTITAHMMAHIGFSQYARDQQAKAWNVVAWRPFQHCRFCIVGFGRVGRAVAAQAKRLGMEVVGTRGTAQPTENVDTVFGPTGLHEALAGSDFVSVHAAETPDTRGLIDDAALAAMKDGVIFLNAARGPVADGAALLRALESGKIKAAILDVFDQEPLPPDNPLWEHERVIVTPHMADTVTTWREHMAEAFCENLRRWIDGAPLKNAVDPSKGY